MANGDPLDCPALDKEAGEEFLEEAFRILMEEAVKKGTEVAEKVCDCGEPRARVLERCRDIIRYSVKTCGCPNIPRFSITPCSLITPCPTVTGYVAFLFRYTYEIAPVFVLMEEVVLKKLRELIGWASGDGIFCPGGSLSNMFAMNVARYQRFPDCKRKGNWALPRLAAFTSQEVSQWGAVGFSPGAWEQICNAKSKGAVPFFVNATCGTTVLGAFDPLAEIAEVCSRHGAWLHVDAAWGGSALLSRRHRHLLDGIERWAPCQAVGCNLTPSAGLLQRCHGAHATYLFQTDKFYDLAYDTGDKTIQCGRKVDCLKLWLMWQAYGTRGLEGRVDRAFAYTRYLVDEMKKRPGFQLVIEPEFINLCFWFVPPSLRGRQGDADYELRLGRVAPTIKERMMRKGSMMVSYQPHGTKVNFFRQVVTNPTVTKADLDFFLEEIERLGEDL
uniref:Cysteine sulfinic acid decarboxylase n=1 Tax=Sphenodon punctatus TaxID=8508 RepID=A0A8D0HJZ3_SPHPU